MKMKTDPPFTLCSSFHGPGRPTSYSLSFRLAVPAASSQTFPRGAMLSQTHASSCLPDGSKLFNKFPNFSFPTGTSFQCYLVTSVSLHVTYGPVVPMAVSDFPVEKCSKQWGSLMPCWARSSPGCQAEVRITLLRFAGCLLPCLDLPHWTDSLIPRAFPQGFTKLPRAVTGLFDTAGKKEKSCRMAEDCSQVVIAFHRCPLWPSLQNCISLLFLPLKWRWQWSCCRKSFAKLNTSHFTPLSVKWCEMWVGA